MAIMMKPSGGAYLRAPFPTWISSFSSSEIPSKAQAQALEALLLNPIRFVPASHLTKEDEAKMVQLRPRKIVRKNENARQARRKQKSQHISRSWGPLRENGLRSQGMWNPRVLCYRRSTLQTLMHLPIFLNWLAEDHRQHQGLVEAQKCLACHLRDLKDSYWQAGTTLGTIKAQLVRIDRLCRNIGWSLPPNTQQDAQEFLHWIVQTMRSQLLQQQADIIDGMFGIELQSRYKCPRCKRVTQQPSAQELELAIQLRPKQKLPSLPNYVKPYFNEVLQGVRCSHCQHQSDKKRTISISLAPDVLVLPLKRFQVDHRGSTKISDKVNFGEKLDLSLYSSELAQREQGTLKYRLSSVVHHAGNLHQGHYQNVAKGPDEKWRVLDDAQSSLGKLTHATKPNGNWTPYILTYVRDDVVTANATP
ncbi:MAG: hypothetical protein M1819_001554 [Sarea resinae]|nr:MAG: hypothetical protein M1819_001554 [Sarea resinae]